VKVYIEAYGCTQNYGEARLMQEALAGHGHTITSSAAQADAHVLVTCTVIETTERKMVRRMSELAAHDRPFVVAGCMAAAQRGRAGGFPHDGGHPSEARSGSTITAGVRMTTNSWSSTSRGSFGSLTIRSSAPSRHGLPES